MKNFTYYRPESAEQAVGLLGGKWGTIELLAGGTDLHDLQKQYVAQPEKVVSLNGITDLQEIRAHDKGTPPTLEIGAGVTLATIAGSPTLRKAYPGLTTAAGDVGGPQIRNMGTLGGNLCQRNRCWYFRDEHVNCLLKGGQRCFALDGENKYHAVFPQGSRCVIVNPSTLAPVLIALEATAEVQGPRGRRTVELGKFFFAPSAANERETTIAPNEVVLSVTIPTASTRSNASYEVRHKQSYDWPLVQAAVAFQRNDGKVQGARIVLGHVAPTPHLAEAAARAINGRAITDETITAAGRAAIEGAKPLSQNAYKLKLIEVAVKRALLIAAGQKRYWET
jgi:xanthine dehydrogenase YagS FAD-binding subunit